MQTVAEVKAIVAEAAICVDAAILSAERLPVPISESADWKEMVDMLREAANLLHQLNGEDTGTSP